MAVRRSKGQRGASYITEEVVGNVAPQMLASAQAHQEAARLLHDTAGAQSLSDPHTWVLSMVSFEQILLSVEQSMRLLLLLHFGSLHSSHNPHALFRNIRNKSGGHSGPKEALLENTNKCRYAVGLPPVSEEDLAKVFKKHQSSYSDFRYFGVDEQADVSHRLGFNASDLQIMHLVALGIIATNIEEIKRRGFKIYATPSPVPEEEMTDELRALKAEMLSRH